MNDSHRLALLSLLRSLEWSARENNYCGQLREACPVCRQFDPECEYNEIKAHYGHTEDCPLIVAIKALEVPV